MDTIDENFIYYNNYNNKNNITYKHQYQKLENVYDIKFSNITNKSKSCLQSLKLSRQIN